AESHPFCCTENVRSRPGAPLLATVVGFLTIIRKDLGNGRFVLRRIGLRLRLGRRALHASDPVRFGCGCGRYLVVPFLARRNNLRVGRILSQGGRAAAARDHRREGHGEGRLWKPTSQTGQWCSHGTRHFTANATRFGGWLLT